MADDEPHLLIAREPGLGIVRMNRPERLNAISPAMRELFETEVLQMTRDPQVRAILLTGTGRAFCAGGDVSTMKGGRTADSILAGMRGMHAWLVKLRLADTVIISAVNGVAAGGGFGLALMGDVIVASDAAVFKGAFTALGVAPDFGLGWTLPQAVGQVRAREMLFSERTVDAREALEIGLVAQVWPAAEFEARALELARRLARGPLSLGLTKRLLNHQDVAGLSAYLEAEAQAQLIAFQSEDFMEGVAAFKEKRPPAFNRR